MRHEPGRRFLQIAWLKSDAPFRGDGFMGDSLRIVAKLIDARWTPRLTASRRKGDMNVETREA